MLVMPYSSSNIYNPEIQFAPLGSFQINRTTTIKMSQLQTSQILTRWAWNITQNQSTAMCKWHSRCYTWIYSTITLQSIKNFWHKKFAEVEPHTFVLMVGSYTHYKKRCVTEDVSPLLYLLGLTNFCHTVLLLTCNQTAHVHNVIEFALVDYRVKNARQ